MKIKKPSKRAMRNATYGLAELGIATRNHPVLWDEAKAYALAKVPGAPRRKKSKAPIWTTSEVQVARKRYLKLGGNYSMPGNYKTLLAQLISMLPDSNLLGSSSKMEKNVAVGVLTKVVYLAPAWESGVVVCPQFGICGKYCIGHSTGYMTMAAQRRSRLAKTMLWLLFSDFFLWKIELEANNLIAEAAGKDLIPSIRMNGSSDVRWEKYGLMQRIPSITWYDYTKLPLDQRGDNGRLPPNYHLTFSVDERPASIACGIRYLEAGHNVAIVVGADWHDSEPAAREAQEAVLKRRFLGNYPVISGDIHDARFLDASGHWILLHAKSRGANDSEGFVYRFDRSGRMVNEESVFGQPNRIWR